ncbi:MAG: hypothetical protein HYZ37_07795 [Candidatus Solibacter usitatus]|nr:hypothetical protein [Candidatus Solibacter usitatus]
MSKAKQETVKLDATERNIDKAIHRVYQTYGTNLSAYFSDLQRRLQQDQSAQASEKRAPKSRRSGA